MRSGLAATQIERRVFFVGAMWFKSGFLWFKMVQKSSKRQKSCGRINSNPKPIAKSIFLLVDGWLVVGSSGVAGGGRW